MTRRGWSPASWDGRRVASYEESLERVARSSVGWPPRPRSCVSGTRADARTMESSEWGLTRNEADHLVLGGCDLVALARRYGTPLHVADETALRRNYGALLGATSAGASRARVFYSYKSNCVPGLLRVLHDEGCGAEVTSPYELWLARRLGVPPPQIVYNGVNKSADDLRAAVEFGVGLINVDSLAEL